MCWDSALNKFQRNVDGWNSGLNEEEYFTVTLGWGSAPALNKESFTVTSGWDLTLSKDFFVIALG